MENKNQAFNWGDFFSFKHMIALQILQILYVLVAIALTIWGLTLLLVGNEMLGAIARLEGLLVIVFGNIFWRVWCELIIVMFRINKTLNNIDNNTGNKV